MNFSKNSQLSRECKVDGCDERGNFKKGVCPDHERAIYGKTPSKKSYGRNRNSTIKKKPKTERQKAKDEIQRYARVRDANNQGVMKCITCNRIITWNKNTDGGHCRPAHMEGTCFDERNINGQCKICNGRGMQSSEVIAKYAVALDKKWGKGTYDEIFRTSLVSTSRKPDYEYQQIAIYYKKKADALIKEKGL